MDESLGSPEGFSGILGPPGHEGLPWPAGGPMQVPRGDDAMERSHGNGLFPGTLGGLLPAAQQPDQAACLWVLGDRACHSFCWLPKGQQLGRR
eukprot:1254261-Lingulodinium_polyedra.AAC.1